MSTTSYFDWVKVVVDSESYNGYFTGDSNIHVSLNQDSAYFPYTGRVSRSKTVTATDNTGSTTYAMSISQSGKPHFLNATAPGNVTPSGGTGTSSDPFKITGNGARGINTVTVNTTSNSKYVKIESTGETGQSPYWVTADSMYFSVVGSGETNKISQIVHNFPNAVIYKKKTGLATLPAPVLLGFLGWGNIYVADASTPMIASFSSDAYHLVVINLDQFKAALNKYLSDHPFGSIKTADEFISEYFEVVAQGDTSTTDCGAGHEYSTVSNFLIYFPQVNKDVSFTIKYVGVGDSTDTNKTITYYYKQTGVAASILVSPQSVAFAYNTTSTTNGLVNVTPDNVTWKLV